MILISAKVGPFKSIVEPQTVQLDPKVTVLVGMNEAGKTVFMQALEKSLDALAVAKFDPVEDYPRKDLPTYLRRHGTTPAVVTSLTYQLDSVEVAQVNRAFGTRLADGWTFSITSTYDNKVTIGISIDERPAIDALCETTGLSSDAREAIRGATSIRKIPDALAEISQTAEDAAFLTTITQRTEKTKWPNVLEFEVWSWLSPRRPRFLYFGDYDLLPSKMNLLDLADRVKRSTNDPKALETKHRAVLALLRMASISMEEFSSPGGYEPLKAKIEGVSINLTDQIMEFWKQNEDLEVEVDIKPDPDDVAPFNNGPNLYLRIRNRRHRGVSTPFRQRSRGFIWFFSFLVWFDSVQDQLEQTGGKDLILLLDEPGLSLHALAQADFLKYIDRLSEKHQVLYTTHSPFMVHMDRLAQVRLVEDRVKVGSIITDNIFDSDRRTIFPLQAALGWTIAQSLFISERNLLVEGPADLIYLEFFSNQLDRLGRTGLRSDITIVPTGGLDKVVTFVALLGANALKLAVLHDYSGAPEQKLLDLVRQKMISPRAILDASQFRDLGRIGSHGPPTDLEDLLSVEMYIAYFNRTFGPKLGGADVRETEVPPGDRIIDRLSRLLEARSVKLRASGGFNHYAVASTFASNPPATVDPATLDRFEAIFKAVNDLF